MLASEYLLLSFLDRNKEEHHMEKMIDISRWQDTLDVDR